jgi:hypothetical protein
MNQVSESEGRRETEREARRREWQVEVIYLYPTCRYDILETECLGFVVILEKALL